jgi:hypothetical protein
MPILAEPQNQTTKTNQNPLQNQRCFPGDMGLESIQPIAKRAEEAEGYPHLKIGLGNLQPFSNHTKSV